jgi:hypothetical protein
MSGSPLTAGSVADRPVREPTRPLRVRRLNTVLVVIGAILLTVHLNSFRLPIAGVEAAPHDLATLFAAILLLVGSKERRVFYGWQGVLAAAVILFVAWSLLTTLWARAGYAGVFIPTQGRFMVLFAALVVLAPWRWDPDVLGSVNRTVWVLSLWIVTVGVALYVFSWATGRQFLVLPGFGAIRIGILDHFGIPRAIGLAWDPNLFSLWLVPGFMVGLFGSVATGWSRIYGILAMGLMIVLSISRTTLVAVPLALVAGSLFYSVLSRDELRLRLRLLGRVLGATFLAGVAALALILMFRPLAAFFAARLELGTGSRLGRLEVLRQTLSMEDVLWGLGPRGAHFVYGGYSHNTYMDVFIDFGFIGAALWALILTMVGVGLLRALRMSAEWLPWVAFYLALGVGMATYSLLTHPMLALVIAMGAFAFRHIEQARRPRPI